MVLIKLCLSLVGDFKGKPVTKNNNHAIILSLNFVETDCRNVSTSGTKVLLKELWSLGSLPIEPLGYQSSQRSSLQVLVYTFCIFSKEPETFTRMHIKRNQNPIFYSVSGDVWVVCWSQHLIK